MPLVCACVFDVAPYPCHGLCFDAGTASLALLCSRRRPGGRARGGVCVDRGSPTIAVALKCPAKTKAAVVSAAAAA
eukprot:9327749-Lingulodinium_polyedra.AAC.1